MSCCQACTSTTGKRGVGGATSMVASAVNDPAGNVPRVAVRSPRAPDGKSMAQARAGRAGANTANSAPHPSTAPAATSDRAVDDHRDDRDDDDDDEDDDGRG
jgi:hypothetical protein